MDMCDGCADRQQWLLDSGDGSQVICLCQVENSQVEDNIVSVYYQSKSYFSMDMCDACADRQQWLLD